MEACVSSTINIPPDSASACDFPSFGRDGHVLEGGGQQIGLREHMVGDRTTSATHTPHVISHENNHIPELLYRIEDSEQTKTR